MILLDKRKNLLIATVGVVVGEKQFRGALMSLGFTAQQAAECPWMASADTGASLNFLAMDADPDNWIGVLAFRDWDIDPLGMLADVVRASVDIWLRANARQYRGVEHQSRDVARMVATIHRALAEMYVAHATEYAAGK